MNLSELETYWQDVHRELGSRLPGDALLVEGNPEPVRRLTHYGHWLGMRPLLTQLGNLNGRRVLDLGCGRGRWSAMFAARGARVTGVDWSAEALAQARRAAPGAEFHRMSITSLEFPAESFDVVSSVTVIQHLPLEEHDKVFREAARVLAPGGHFLVLELISRQSGPHVFPRPVEGWTQIAESAGFAVMACRGCSYELLLRPYKRARQALSPPEGKTPARLPGLGTTRPSPMQRLNRWAMSSLGLVSIPLEWMSQALPSSLATHGAFLFRKV